MEENWNIYQMQFDLTPKGGGEGDILSMGLQQKLYQTYIYYKTQTVNFSKVFSLIYCIGL